MAMTHSPRRTRSSALTTVPESEANYSRDTASSSEAAMLQRMAEELRQLRAEREAEQRELRELRRRGDSADQQLSPSHNNAAVAKEIGYKIKPDDFDGSVPLSEYFAQFNLIASANNWADRVKSVVLASHLRGKARSVLECLDMANFSFLELKEKLELRFGERNMSQTYYTRFTNRKQQLGESYAELGSDLERLSRFAYAECSYEVRDKIACAQFINAITDGFVKQTLQLENITSLKIAIERALAIEIINKSCFLRSKEEDRKENFFRKDERRNKVSEQRLHFRRERESGESVKREKGGKVGGSDQKNVWKNKECWQCGKSGHFRSDCPNILPSEKN